MEFLTINMDLLHRDPNTYQNYASNFSDRANSYAFKTRSQNLCVVNLKINHWSQFYVENAYSITISRKSIYPSTTQILLTINVNTWLQSCELSTPLPQDAILFAMSTGQYSSPLINVSNRTQSTLLQPRELSTPLPQDAILFALSTGQ